MCHILRRLLLSVVRSLFLCVLCVNIYFMRYFSHFLLLYIDVCFFVDFFITKLYSSLLFFKIYSKNHYLLFCWKAFISMCFFLFFVFVFFIPNDFPYIFFHRKVLMKVSCYIIYFSHTILIFWLFFISLYYMCRIHSTLTLGENEKYSVDWFVLVADEIGMSTNNGGCCKFPNLYDPKHFIK